MTIDTDTTDLLASMTPATLIAMYADALEAEEPEVAGAIRITLAALVGDGEAYVMLTAPEPPVRKQNDAAVDAFLRNIGRAREIVAKIDQALDDHLGILPEDVALGRRGHRRSGGRRPGARPGLHHG